MSGSDEDPLFGGAGGLDELGPRRKRAEDPASAETPASSPGPDLSELESVPPDAGPALELESLKPVPGPAAAPPAPGPPGPPAGASLLGAEAPSRSVVERPTAPAGYEVLPPAPQDRLPTMEVAAAAEYGPAPGFLGAIPYALHVWNRRKEIVTASEAARQHRKSAEVDVENALAALGKSIVERSDSLGGAVEALTEDLEGARAAVELVGSQQEAAVRADADAERQRRQMTAELETVRRELTPYQDREAKLATQLGVREQELARAKAKHQRAQIEQRNAEHDPARSAESRALAAADLERHQKEVEVAERNVRDLSEKLVEIKREIAERLGRAAQLEDDLRSLDSRKDQTKRAQLASESDAARAARKALALLARRAIAAGVAGAADPEATARAARADEDLTRRRRRERILRAAIDSYDKPTVYQGLGILGAAVLVVLIFVLFVIGRAIF